MFNCKICGKDFNYMNQTLAENEKRKRLKRHEVLCIARLEKETEIFKCKNVDLYLMMILILTVRKGKD